MTTVRSHVISLNHLDGDDHNTIVLGGLDVVIPLEIDFDGDASVEDEVRLRSDDGWFEAHVKESEATVEREGDKPILLYTFEAVPPGVYTVSAKVGEEFWDILTGLRVTRDTVKYDDKSFVGSSSDRDKLGVPDDEGEELAEDEEPEDEETSCGA
jgi:hypothetical protein